MSEFDSLLAPYIIHFKEISEKPNKRLEVAVYSLDEKDIKFRVMKFLNGQFKEMQTYEKKEEAIEAAGKMLGVK
jgi:hypothetical protein